ncbi:MAG: hypothetical protein JW732_03755 [Dehalococcoidia bacterium]|nr:hypothetical protein [Dehalococcoidia bacterium]
MIYDATTPMSVTVYFDATRTSSGPPVPAMDSVWTKVFQFSISNARLSPMFSNITGEVKLFPSTQSGIRVW